MAQPQQGDWGRFNNGSIGYTGTRKPRIIQATIPNGLRDSWTYKVSNGTVTLEGKTTIPIQIGWIYEGRLRYHDYSYPDKPFVRGIWLAPETKGTSPVTGVYDFIFPQNEILSTAKTPSGSDEVNFTLLAAGAVCNLQKGDVGKVFWNPVISGLGLAEPKEDSKFWYAISDGLGGVTWEQRSS